MIENATKKCIYFSHLLLQEFFAAVYCLYFMNFIKFYLTFFSPFKDFCQTDNRFEMITKFMFGLSNPQTFETLKEIYPSISKPTKRTKWLQDLATAEIASIRSPISLFRSSDFQPACIWAYESQDPKFSETLAESLLKTLQVNINNLLLPSDVLSLCYVVKARKSILELDFMFDVFISFSAPSTKNCVNLLRKEMDSILDDSSNIRFITLI